MTEKRVVFDFEVDFANGGGIQGQGFRLDIDGDDIDDDALAAFIIRDLRLLMVGEVRILDKQVVSEAHKRNRAVEHAAAGDDTRLVELSHDLVDGMITYRGLPAPLVCDHLSFDDSRAHYGEGVEFSIGRVEMVGNTGTYIDVPRHRYRQGEDFSQVGLDRIADLPAVVVRVTGMSGRAIDWTLFAAAPVAGHAALVHTGWDAHWRTDRYFEGHPFLTAKAAEYLRDEGAALVGIDSLNIDDTADDRRPVHSVLLGAGIPIVEHMTALDRLPESGFRFTAAPPKVAGMGSFPVRAFARL